MRILIVDDDPVQRRIVEEVVTRLGYEAVSAENGEAAMALLADGAAQRFDAVVLDLVMPELDGMGVLERMRKSLASPPPVIVQTAQGGLDTAVTAMRAGAFDFLVKPASPERIRVSLANVLKLDALEHEVTRFKRSQSGTLTFDDIIMASAAMDRVAELGQRAAQSSIPVLVEGESGVGKELIARAIQGSGPRRSKPFVTVNCGAIPENLVESVLFGHEKGAFTGATEKHLGKFQEANGGTLFLDEVGELPQEAQVKLLRALQEGEVDPVGGRKAVRTDFRLIAATNRRLIDLVSEGSFREDLFYRLNVFPIWVPPLRERIDDIPELVRHFTARFAAEEGRKALTGPSTATLDLLMSYHWPGNIRQLENAVFRAVVLSDGETLKPEDFPQIVASVDPQSARSRIVGASLAAAPQNDVAGGPPGADNTARNDNRSPVGRADAGDRSGRERQKMPHYGTMTMFDEFGEIRRFEALEEETIRFAVDHYRGRMSEVARRLGIGRSTLYRKLKDYGISTEDATAA
jgi:DNA-binding NtrC family response regulator